MAFPLKIDEHGDSPDAIHQGFDVLPLNDLYTVIAYYLAHQAELDIYLQQGQEAASDMGSPLHP